MIIYSSILQDYKASFKSNGNFIKIVKGIVRMPGFRASILYRLGHKNWMEGNRIRAALYSRAIRITCCMDIEIAAEIGPGICFPHTWGIVIGGLSKIGCNCKIMQGVTLGGAGGKKRGNGQSQPHLSDFVLIGAGAKLLGPIRVGNGAQIGANAVVVDDVADGDVVVGVPARSVKRNVK